MWTLIKLYQGLFTHKKSIRRDYIDWCWSFVYWLNANINQRREIISWSRNNSTRKQNKSNANDISLSSSEQDEKKVQSAGKKYSWKKTCRVNKRRYFWKTKEHLWKTIGYFWKTRHFWKTKGQFWKRKEQYWK